MSQKKRLKNTLALCVEICHGIAPVGRVPCVEWLATQLAKTIILATPYHISLIQRDNRLIGEQMTLNTFTPSSKELAWWKVMQSPDLMTILKTMESGATIDTTKVEFSYNVAALWKNGIFVTGVSRRKVRTLERAGLIAPVEYDDYIEYRLTYTGTFEELVRK